MKYPQHLLEAWKQVQRRVRRASQVVLLTDFDGTLVRIARSPEQVRLSPRVRRLLSNLSQKGVLVGVVSGRKFSDVRGRVGLRGIWYVGAHGYSLSRPGSQPLVLLDLTQKARMAATRRLLGRKVRGLRGIRLERKDGVIAIHYRNASRRTATSAEVAVRHVLEIHPYLRLLPGKKVWDLLPEGLTSKWTAVQLIRKHARRSGSHLLFYLGDDSTDEPVFEQMKGISVVVGKRRRTVARFYLRSPGEVLLFLERLCEILK